MKKISLILGALVLLLGAGCTTAKLQQTTTTPSANEATKTPITTTTSNIFDPVKNKPGDDVAGFKVLSIGSVTGNKGSIGADNVDAAFSGNAQVTGSYEYFLNELGGYEQVCLQLTDPKDMAKIPRLATVDYVRFCFHNLAAAKAAFGPAYGKGTATVVIDTYNLRFAPADLLYNETNFVSLVQKNLAK